MERPRQVNCQNEPPYPEHETVVFALGYPEWTAHQESVRCVKGYPHRADECGEFEEE